MSFAIVLMENLSPSNKVGKNKTAIATATGNLRNGSSVLDPVFEIDSSLSSDILGRVNYAHIELWHRYYFVTDIKVDITGLWNIYMHVDVLDSYESEIRSLDAIVARQERRNNMYLDDGWFMSYQNPDVYTQYFSNESPFLRDGEYVLVVAGS